MEPLSTVFFGGTGFIGSQVIAQLRTSSHPMNKLTVVSRQPKKPSEFLDAQVQWLQGDIVKEPHGKWIESAAQASHIFYAVQFPGHPVENPRKGFTYEAYDWGGFQNLIHGLERLGATPRIIYVSGAGAGQNRKEPWYVAKDKAELALKAYSERTGVACLSLRPSVVYGAKDSSLNRLLKIAKVTRVLPYLGDGKVKLYPIWVNDLARALVEFGFFSNLGGAYDFPGPVTMSLRELLEELCKAHGVRAWHLTSPLVFARLAGTVAECLPGQLLSRGAVDFLTTEVPMAKHPDFQSFLEQCKKPQEAFRLYTDSIS